MQTTGWLIYKQSDALANHHYIDWFQEEALKQGVQLKLIYCEDLSFGIVNNKRTIYCKEKEQTPPDFCVMRTIHLYLSLELEQLGVRVFNSSKIAHICNDKALTHHHVHNLGIPMVDTIFIKGKSLPATFPFPYPVVIKDVKSHGGKDVHMAHSHRELKHIMDHTQENDFVIQATNVKYGKDVRVFVMGKTIIGAVLRTSSTDFRANFKLGGTVRQYHLTAAERKTVQTIIQAFDFDFVGIDFLIGENNELSFNEIEDVVGSRTLYKVSKINILKHYITYIKQKIKVGP